MAALTKYAANTTVSVEKSKAEIETIVSRYGASGFASGWQGSKAQIQFICQGRHIRFVMELPDRADKRFTDYKRGSVPHRRSPEAAAKEWEQACRQKWRALALLVKAKLEAVDAKISTFEEAFFADIVMPDGRTVYETAREHVAIAYSTGKPVALLGVPQ